MIKNLNNSGYTLIELVLSVFVGSIVLAGAYASYSVVSGQFNRNSAISEIRDFAVPTIKILTRDLRMAGYRAVDSNIESTYARINPPISITDVNAACCDSFSVIYDKALDNRIRVSYFVANRNNPTRNALYMDIDQWNGTSWINQVNDAIVADYVEDFQIAGRNNNSSGFPTIIDLNIVFRSKNKTTGTNTFTKPAYSFGNNNGYSITDNHLRESFDYTIRLRNISN
jgi:prepilin-type N-terminal cleavage/methylation domain-containing protein